MKNLNLGFSSDNTAGAHPKIMNAIVEANLGYSKAYGEDDFCKASDAAFQKIFGEDIDTCLALSGTGANVLALRAMLRPWQGVICTEMAHINTEESGAPEACIGSKILPVTSVNGKMKPSDIDMYLADKDSLHRSSPAVVSITQSTEKGTLYSLEEIKNICSYAHQNNLLVHMDGARISNACVALDIDIKTMTKDAGVDVLSLGGAKNGLVFGEAIVFFNRTLSHDYATMRKQSLQLISKMRFIAAQFIEYFKNDLWLENARYANNMAQYLAEELSSIKSIQIQKPEANAVFVTMTNTAMQTLMEKYYCYETDPNEVRLMCSFATQKSEIDDLVQYMKKIAS